VPEPRTLLTDLILGESPRWHDDRLWFSDWGAQEVLAVDLEGTREVIVRVPVKRSAAASTRKSGTRPAAPRTRRGPELRPVQLGAL